MKIRTTKKEIQALIKTWLILTIAITIIITKPQIIHKNTLTIFFISTIIVATTLTIKEITKKIIAKKQYCLTEYETNNTLLLITAILSFIGIMFGAQGKNEIKGNTNKKQTLKITTTGPIIHITLAIISLIGLTLTKQITALIFYITLLLNTWLGIFEMIPTKPFTGHTILKTNKTIYSLLTIIMLAITINTILI